MDGPPSPCCGVSTIFSQQRRVAISLQQRPYSLRLSLLHHHAGIAYVNAAYQRMLLQWWWALWCTTTATTGTGSTTMPAPPPPPLLPLPRPASRAGRPQWDYPEINGRRCAAPPSGASLVGVSRSSAARGVGRAAQSLRTVNTGWGGTPWWWRLGHGWGVNERDRGA